MNTVQSNTPLSVIAERVADEFIKQTSKVIDGSDSGAKVYYGRRMFYPLILSALEEATAEKDKKVRKEAIEKCYSKYIEVQSTSNFMPLSKDEFLLIIRSMIEDPVLSHCQCACGWIGEVLDCQIGKEDDGPYTTEYTVHICPAKDCKEDYIESYMTEWEYDILVKDQTITSLQATVGELVEGLKAVEFTYDSCQPNKDGNVTRLLSDKAMISNMLFIARNTLILYETKHSESKQTTPNSLHSEKQVNGNSHPTDEGEIK